MRLYPQIPSQRLATILRDLVVLALLVLFGWVGLKVHDAIAELAVLGRGVESAGSAVVTGFEAAAEAVDGTPAIGDDLAEGLRQAGEGTGGEAVELGQRSQERVDRAAKLLGAVVFGIPALLLLLQFLPPRIRLVRAVTAAHRALVEAGSPEERRLVAMRAAFSLPYAELARHTRDPFGDLAAGRYDPLVAAAYEHAGLRPPRRPGG